MEKSANPLRAGKFDNLTGQLAGAFIASMAVAITFFGPQTGGSTAWAQPTPWTGPQNSLSTGTAPSTSTRRQEAGVAPLHTSPGSGDRILQVVAERLANYSSLRATLRQEIKLFGNTLIGVGEYHQIRHGRDLLFRTDLRIQLEDRASVYQETCDGRFLWRYYDSPSIDELGTFRQKLVQIDLDEVKRAVPTGKLAPTLSVGQGGLPRLLNQLREHMKFEPSVPGTHQQVPVWLIRGEWHDKAFQALHEGHEELPSGTDKVKALTRLPQQIPHFVTLTIGREDLFPYRMEFWRYTSGSAQNGIVVSANKKRTIVLDLFEVEFNAAIDPSKFDRSTVDIPFVDGTAEYMKQNGLELPGI